MGAFRSIRAPCLSRQKSCVPFPFIGGEDDDQGMPQMVINHTDFIITIVIGLWPFVVVVVLPGK
jgi:hypothetical protein